MVRECTLDDVSDLVEMGRKFFFASGMPGTFDAEKSAAFITGLITSETGIALRTDGGMVGGVLMGIYCSDAVVAVEIAWWSEDCAGGDLRRAFEAKAKAMGAGHVRFSTIAALGDRAERILRRAGYVPVEISYGKAL
jgi:hypothetical protein